MKILNDTVQLLTNALTHYVCMRLQFRSSVLGDSLHQKNTELCLENCCPAKS